MEIDAINETRKCYYCNIKVHLAKECRQKKKKKFNRENKNQGNTGQNGEKTLKEKETLQIIRLKSQR